MNGVGEKDVPNQEHNEMGVSNPNQSDTIKVRYEGCRWAGEQKCSDNVK